MKRARVDHTHTWTNILIKYILPRVQFEYVTDIFRMRLICRAIRNIIDSRDQDFWNQYGLVNMPGLPFAPDVLAVVKLMMVGVQRSRNRLIRVGVNGHDIQVVIENYRALPRLVMFNRASFINVFGSVALYFPLRWARDDESSLLDIFDHITAPPPCSVVIFCSTTLDDYVRGWKHAHGQSFRSRVEID